MVSIVVVSHSEKLAEGVKELAQQMVQGSVSLAVAAGVDDPEHPIGTDVSRVQAAIESVYSDAGVLVLMDLGSALLSAEMALEFLTPEQRANVRLCPAPLVEGTMAAAVQASIGASLDEVYREALGGLTPKQEQMGTDSGAEMTGPESVEEGLEATLVIRNPLGLHARPAAQFVRTANRFSAAVRVHKEDRTANAKSINQIATLGARQGDEITVAASGQDAPQALSALTELVESLFGEEEEIETEAIAESVPSQPGDVRSPDRVIEGIAASPGVAIGPAVHYSRQLPEIKTTATEDPEADWKRLREAIEAARTDLAELQNQMWQSGYETEAGIFDAHILILEDPVLLDEIEARIRDENVSAAVAWRQALQEMAERYRGLQDEYMQARAADVVDVAHRVLRHLLDETTAHFDLEKPSILVAADLTPSDTAQIDPDQLLAFCTQLGGATSHSAILARAMGIPAVVGLGPGLQQIQDGQRIAIDGQRGWVWPDPGPQELQELQALRRQWLEKQASAREAALEPARTTDGKRIEVAANIGSVEEAGTALGNGAEGVGLFRTEFLFLNRQSAPSESEQFDVYRQVATLMEDRPLIIRTLDVGGDKPLPYADMEQEANPFLGSRGIRYCLDHPQLFLPQLRAILRAGQGYNVKIMFPMISTVGELRSARQLLEQARGELRRDGIPFNDDLDMGIMIEVPSAVAMADQLAQAVDFFSIGTNDLTQYVMAADRGNRQVASLADALQPAVLRMVRQTVHAAHRAGIWIGMCGELAGNPLATPLLVGMGLDELSMNAPSIPHVKAAIRRLDTARAGDLAETVLDAESVTQVTALLQEASEPNDSS